MEERMIAARPSAVATSTILDARDLHKTFGEREVVRGVSFHINAGEIFGLLGPNGAGKSTTINMLATYLAPTSGTATVAGISITDREQVKRSIGLVPQEIALYEDLSAEENMRFFGEVYGIHGAALTERIDLLLDRVGLLDRKTEKVSTFSGGMQRRLNLAVGLIHEPPLLMLDEPTVGVDPQTREAIFELAEHLRDTGTALLYTTHYMEEAERLCDRIAIIDEGLIVAEGTLAELLETRTAEPVTRTERPHGLAEVFLQLTGRQYRD
jgi:ABC-2 type transport system ATP-binding protein